MRLANGLQYPVTLFALVFYHVLVFADVAPADYRQQQSDQVWEETLRHANFQDREIKEGAEQNIFEVKAPYTAEDATVVPISIHTKISQQDENYIKRIHIFVDKNPLPLVGVFDFSKESGKADIAMRIRVDTFSYVRAIAELNTGELYMTKSFVRARGACSAPPPASIEDSKKLLGKMKLKNIGDLELGAFTAHAKLGDLEPGKPSLVQLKIRHPNITGMAPLRVGSHVIPPAHYVSDLVVDYNGKQILKASLTFSVSMDPAFRFYFTPQESGTMTVSGMDTKKNKFSSSFNMQI